MLKKYEEKDFMKLEEIASERLLPSNISVGLLGMLFFSGVINAVLLHAVSYSSYINHPAWNIVVPFSIGVFIIQAAITLFFFNEKRAFAYQNFQSIFVCLVTFKLSIEGYLIFFTIYEDRFAPTYFSYLAIIFLLGGIIFLFISTLRAVNRVRDGHFREGGKGLFNFSNSKSFISIPIIFGATMTGGAITRMLGNSIHPLSDMLEIYFILFIIAILQFAIAIAWPEFLLLAYCKRRFQSFKIEAPIRVESRK